jgi:hypothetical protein
MHLRLIPPSPAYFPEIIAFRQEFLDRGERMYGAPSLDKYENLHDWLAHLDAFSSPETCPQGSAPSLQLRNRLPRFRADCRHGKPASSLDAVSA